MSVIDVALRTITCNTCGKTVTFDPQNAKTLLEDNPWVKTVRIIQTLQGRNFAYDSDECELKAIEEGHHNPEEAKKVIAMPGAGAIAVAAAAAEAQERANKALKEGSGVTLQGS